MNKPWVEKYMVPLQACREVIEKANKYDDPQTAWDNWDNGIELFWTLGKTGADNRKITLCRCEIVDRVIPLYEKEPPKDMRPRDANEAARRWANNPTEENRKSRDAACSAAWYAAFDAARSAARSAARAAAWDAAWDAAEAAAWDAERAAAWDAAEAAAWDAERAAAWDAAEATAWDSAEAAVCSAEIQWQADCVRRHFPVSPFCEMTTLQISDNATLVKMLTENCEDQAARIAELEAKNKEFCDDLDRLTEIKEDFENSCAYHNLQRIDRLLHLLGQAQEEIDRLNTLVDQKIWPGGGSKEEDDAEPDIVGVWTTEPPREDKETWSVYHVNGSTSCVRTFYSKNNGKFCVHCLNSHGSFCQSLTAFIKSYNPIMWAKLELPKEYR